MDGKRIRLRPATVVQSTFACPRGVTRGTGWGVQMHPSDYMAMKNNGRTPLFTRHDRGVIEAERDRRIHGR